jgi:hypothetical protein
MNTFTVPFHTLRILLADPKVTASFEAVRGFGYVLPVTPEVSEFITAAMTPAGAR